jgi:hypothetical protein
LSVIPASGVVPAGGAATLEVGFDADGLADRDYRGDIRLFANDPASPEVRLPCRLHVGVRGAALDLEPGSLNRNARGKWVSGDLDLPPDLDAGSTVAATVRAQRVLPLADGVAIAFEDLDGDGDEELRLKFDRASLQALLPDGDAVPVEVIGEVDGITWFQAVDHLRLMRAGPATAQGTPPPPAALGLQLAGPSPARGDVRLRLAIPATAPAVAVDVFDLRGARLRSLFDGILAPGWYALSWDGSDGAGRGVASGVYFLRVQAGATRITTRVALIR